MNKRILFTLALSLVSTGLMAHRPENEDLINAVKRHDVAGVQAALGKGAEVNVRDVHDNTPLHLVLSNPITPATKQIITLLISKGALVDLRNQQGQSPADLARTMPHFEDIQELLGVGGCPVCLEDIAPKDDFVRGDELFDCNPQHIAHRTCLFNGAGRRLTVICPTCRATRDAGAARIQREALMLHYFAQQEDVATPIDPTIIAQIIGFGVNARDEYENTALILSAYAGRMEIVAALLAHPETDINAHNRGGRTALIEAVAEGHSEIVHALLARPGIDVNVHTNEGTTALMEALNTNHIEIIHALLAHPGINVNERLIAAAAIGNIAWVQASLTHGANVNARIKRDNTALIMAARNGHTEIVTTLLTNPRIDVNAHNEYGDTAVMLAAYHGNTEVVHALFVHPNIDVHERLIAAATIGDITWIQKSLTQEIDIDAHTYEGTTALIAAADNGHTQTVTTLLVHGARINAHDKVGRTALIKAACSGHTKTVIALLAKDDIDVNAQDAGHETALIKAVSRNQTEMVVALLNHPNIDVNTQNADGTTALMQAARRGNTKIITALLTQRAIEINAQNRRGKTALALAKERGNEEIAHILIEHGARQ